MAVIINNVWLKDNGIRSFIPPCFNWELLTKENSVVIIVSQLVLEIDMENNPIDLDFIVREKLLTSGYAEDYTVNTVSNSIKGIVYIITAINL